VTLSFIDERQFLIVI
jgi:hypothetical protein